MKRFSIILLAISLLSLFALVAVTKADVFRLSIDSADYFDGTAYVGPYHSTVHVNDNLTFPAITFCIDYTSHVGFGEQFGVTIINLHDYVGALHDNYWEAGWLALQIGQTHDAATISDIQRAIWLITTPGTTDPYLTSNAAFGWAQQAYNNYTSVSDSDFLLYLKNGDVGQNQISVVPEPSTYGLAVAGLISLLGFRRLFRRA